MRTNLTSRARLTAGITVALTAGALALAFSAPAGATEPTTPDPETSTSASPDPSPSPSESTSPEPSTSASASASPEPSDSPSPSTSPEPSTSPSPEEPEVKSVVITGKIWRDKNRNGIQDAGEPGAPGIPVVAGALPAGVNFCDLINNEEPEAALKAESKKTNKGFKASAEEADGGEGLTDAQGNYSVKVSTPGRYGVLIVPAAFEEGEEGDVSELFNLTRPNVGDDAKDSDFKPCTIADEEGDFVVGVYDATVTKDSKADLDAGVYNDSDKPVPAPGNGGGSLPNTGLAITGFIVAGLVLVGGGTALTILARRRRQVTTA